MHPYDAYRQTRTEPATRIDVILELYRVALESIERARQALPQGGRAAIRHFLVKSQMCIMGLAGGLPAYKDDDLATTFLRLYTYASGEVVKGTMESLEEAAEVLRTLLGAFEQVRNEAAAMEMTDKIRPLGRDHLVSLKA